MDRERDRYRNQEPPDKRRSLLEELERPAPIATTPIQQKMYNDVLPRLTMEQLLLLRDERHFYYAQEDDTNELFSMRPLQLRCFMEWVSDEVNDLFMSYVHAHPECRGEYLKILDDKLIKIDEMKETIITPPMPPPTLWNMIDLKKYKLVLKKYNQLIERMKDILDIESKLLENARSI